MEQKNTDSSISRPSLATVVKVTGIVPEKTDLLEGVFSRAFALTEKDAKFAVNQLQESGAVLVGPWDWEIADARIVRAYDLSSGIARDLTFTSRKWNIENKEQNT